ncbi:uncharacterized protein LOC143906988 isoform X2 [Temnothorax americanus]|uniref:uncharacterized protein LOC143906988 isoform X2 n=1 Tax=Temnothorax americanus TaxID=1964332 RepID=UPI004068357B
MEKNDGNDGNDGKPKEEELPFGDKENTITILNALFRHGCQDLPFNVIPGTSMSMKDYHSKMDSALKLTETAVENKPSIVDWLRSGLFEEDERNVPLALLFVALYEQRPSPDREDVECNFRELYHFLHKVTTNQPVPHLSRKSANVLYKLLSELMEEVWPNVQPSLLNFLSETHIYSRSAVRRTYSGKS